MIVRTSSWPKHKHFVTLKPNRGLWSTFTQQLPKTNFHLMYHPKIDLVFFLLLEISDSVVAQRYIQGVPDSSSKTLQSNFNWKKVFDFNFLCWRWQLMEKIVLIFYRMGVPWILYNNLSDIAKTMRFLFLNIIYCELNVIHMIS